MIYRPAQSFRVRIEANVGWQFAQDPESGEWIGVCDVLNLNAMGETFREVQECASEAMQLLFLNLFKEGELEGFLRENDWTPQTPLPGRDSYPEFDTSYQSKVTRLRELVPSNA
jgi:predicted RNase H-like HicB family nuclease